jgi:hypothetical protein
MTNQKQLIDRLHTHFLCPAFIRARYWTERGVNRYARDSNGEPSFVVAVPSRDCLGVVDWVAFTSARARRFGSFHGRAFALNEHLLDCTAALMGDPLPVYRTPRELVLAGGHGVVILRPGLAHARIPATLDLYAQDELFARQVERWRQPPKPTGKVYNPRKTEAA